MPEDLCVHVAAFTHPGRVRSHNEDCIAVGSWLQQGSMVQPARFILPLEKPLLCLVADGLGGHAAGEVASRYAAQRLSAAACDLDNDEQAVSDCLLRINAEILTEMRSNPNQIGMGTTVAGLIIAPAGITVVNVGDSRIYHRQENRLLQLSTDDTPEAMYFGSANSPLRSHIITQCLGGLDVQRDIEPHVLTHPLERGYWLLCSDGLTDMLDQHDLETSLSDDLEQTVVTLFNKAMAAGGNDNISIVLVRLDSMEL
jgi:serine/threonine protein phosphatase PrpC